MTTEPVLTSLPTAEPGAASTRPRPHRGSRWIQDWRPENADFWHTTGRAVARRNLFWSIFAEFLGFVVWQLWSIVVVMLPAAGFTLTTAQSFWLISLPSLVGATLRFPYTFMVARFGGRNWTIVSASLLLVPTVLLSVVVAHPETPFGVLLAVAGLAGLGGGNFASSMANITYFFPHREKGWALGLNAAGGNIGTAVAQLLVPVVVSLTAATAVGISIAGWIWIPLILVAVWGAWRHMDNLSTATSDLPASLAALREPHLWLLALLYIGTFGSFIGFAGVFPKLIADEFPAFSSFRIGQAALSLAFLGALVGSLARPYGGRLADRFGGARITLIAFGVMALGALALILVAPAGGFWAFLCCFLLLFAATGIGNGSTYRMIPSVFAARVRVRGTDPVRDAAAARTSSAALGIISAIGAYGGFVIPQLLSASKSATGDYTSAFWGFVAVYALLMVITAMAYAVPRAALGRQRI
ncbi:MFS transporter [Microbacterium protaetiae]|uniref:MFS transporter n=1 Tax=Microbacterium protaetiae TaxID=2509458 RepID=A0A4P6EHY0_9MICO|nr:MFS transporter [Microbacterium protaetiae]QAY61143.1 MFS transporter [Microbacterium protaetiae]